MRRYFRGGVRFGSPKIFFNPASRKKKIPPKKNRGAIFFWRRWAVRCPGVPVSRRSDGRSDGVGGIWGILESLGSLTPPSVLLFLKNYLTALIDFRINNVMSFQNSRISKKMSLRTDGRTITKTLPIMPPSWMTPKKNRSAIFFWRYFLNLWRPVANKSLGRPVVWLGNTK